MSESSSYPKLIEAIEVIRQLRHPEHGCPWDLEQTHQSLLKFLVEECYEFIDAVEDSEKGDREMEDELGDILLQILLHTTIGQERKAFSMESVAANLSQKIIRRHPHVFGDLQSEKLEADQVFANWQEIKATEREREDGTPPPLFGENDLALPPLMGAMEIGKKSKKIAFDWENAQEVSNVVEGEWQELQHEICQENPNQELIAEELGDHLFSLVQLARHLKIDPEKALRDANRKFVRRFIAMEKLIGEEGGDMTKMNQAEMDIFWDRIKQVEKDGKKTKQ